jgi:molybdopterin-dependent oxidoreductase alpha subunit
VKPTPPPSSDPRGAAAQPPDTLIGLRKREPERVAAGIPAIYQAMKHVIGQDGPIKGTRLLARLNQADGFDCPGCAWPDPDGHRSLTEFCENGAKAVAEEGTAERVTPDFFREHSVAELALESDYWLGKRGRLTQPMWLREGATHYEPIEWSAAFELIAYELARLAHPDEAIFYTSGRTSNEAAFLYQLFVRQLGTNNLPDCSNMCHESSGAALTPTIGIGKGTVKLDDFEKADVIVIIGQNPGTNHPRMLTSLLHAVRRGARIVAINPLHETGLVAFKHPQEPLHLIGPGTPLSSLFLQVRINGDVPLLQGVGKELLEMEARAPGTVIARQFVDGHTTGFADYRANLEALRWDDVIAQSGISRAQIRVLAELLAGHERIIFCWAMGLTQHKNAVANIQEIVNLLLLRGSIGKPGAGVCPVRGHSNVQGDRTMGIYEQPSADFLDRLEATFGFSPPRRHGFDVVESIRAMRDGRAQLFFAMGGNFLSATPDTEATAAALRSTRLTVHVSTKLNRSHLVTGRQALILPCLGRTEEDLQGRRPQFVSVENSMGVVHQSRGRARPASEHLLSEPVIVARLARALFGARSVVDWDGLVADYDHIRAAIERVIPGFEDYNERVRQPGGFYLPNGPREGTFTTASGKASFTVHPLPRHELAPGQLLMMTIRSHDQFNTTIYGLQDRYRGLANERRVVLLNDADMAELGIREGAVVDLTSHFRGEQRSASSFVATCYDIPRGCAATYFPEANVLVPLDSVADGSGTPTSKSVVISLSQTRKEQPHMPGILDRDRIIAKPGYSRWLVPPAALAIHLCIGQVYAMSVFNLPMTRLLGIDRSAPGDWKLTSLAAIFSVAIVFLGLSAALFGTWLERVGPRRAMLTSACCFSAGFLIAALGVRLHFFPLLLFGYGVVGGIGLGIGYISPVSTLMKWFPDRPGMATGFAIMGFGGGAMIGSPLAVDLMRHFASPTSLGVAPAFVTMALIYFVVMLFGAATVRVPPPGWAPAGYQPNRPGAHQMITTGQVSAQDAIKTPQFWLLWAALLLNVTAGIGVLEMASPMSQDFFPGHIKAAAAAGFVGLLSIFNMGGRFFWSSISDKLGRKTTYAIYFALGALLYALVPSLGAAHSLVRFVAVFCIILSMYGGGFAAAPAYLRDLFGTFQVGAIHGRLLTAWSVAGIAGPLLINFMRQRQLAHGLAAAQAYNQTMYLLSALLICGFLSNLLIRPVAAWRTS